MNVLTASDLRTHRTLHWFEYLSAAFYYSHGMLAPGKSYPLPMHPPSDEERRDRYAAWRSCLGPSDVACIFSMAILRERQEREE